MKTWDIETKGLGGEIVAIGCYDGEIDSFYIFDTVKEFMDYAGKCEDVFYAHNAGRYDFLYILRDYLNEIRDIRMVKNFIAHFKYGKATFRDSYLLMPDSLKRLTLGFDVQHKKKDYNDYEEHKDREKLLEYLEQDCRGLYECIEAFAKEVEMNVNKLKLTIASTALHKWKDGRKISFPKYDFEDIIRKAYYGGRVEVGRLKCDHAYYYDVNSLYPFSMLNKYPVGRAYYIQSSKLAERYFTKEKHGIYLVTMDIPKMKFAPLPYRQKEGNIYPYGRFTGWYTYPEVLFVREHVKKIHECIIWLEAEPSPFASYVSKYFMMKCNSVGGKKMVAKYLLNSLYGKFGMKRIGSRFLRKVSQEDVDKYPIIRLYGDNAIADCMIYSNTINVIWAAYTTAYARLHMYHYINKYSDDIVYTDTDSIVITKQLPIEDIGWIIGRFKQEYEIEEGYFISSKTYAFKTPEGEVVIKSKGFNSKKLSYDMYRNVVENNAVYCQLQDRMYSLKKGLKEERLSESYSLVKRFEQSLMNRIRVGRYDTFAPELKG